MRWRSLEASQSYQLAALMRQGVGVLVAILLAKSPLAATGIGQYEQLLYVGGVLSSFWLTGLVQALLARYANLAEAKQQAFLGLAYVVVLLAGAGLALLAWGLQSWWLPLLVGQSRLEGLLPFLVYLVLNLPIFLLDNYYLLWKRGRELFWFAVVSHSLQLPLLLLPIYLGYGLMGGLWGLVVLAVLRQAWMLLRIRAVVQWTFDKPLARSWLTAALPLVLYALVGTLSVSFDSWLVNWAYGGDQRTFAIFRYGAREFPLAMALSAAFGAAMLPVLSKDFAAGALELRRRSLRLFHLLFPLTIVLVWSSSWWFPKLFSPTFAESAPLFNVFMLITVSRLVFSRTVLVSLNENRLVFYGSLVELAFNIVLGFMLVSQMGLIGIAWATVAAYTLEKLMMCGYLYYRYGLAPKRYIPLSWLTVYSSLLFTSVLMS